MGDPLEKFNKNHKRVETPKGLEDLAPVKKPKKSMRVSKTVTLLPAHWDYLNAMAGYNGILSRSSALRQILDLYISSRADDAEK